MRRRRRGVLLAGSGGGGAVVQPFSFQPETDALAAAVTVAPTTALKHQWDRLFRRMKTEAGGQILAKTTLMMGVGLDESHTLKNWKTPGTFDPTKVGAPVFTAGQHWIGVTGANYINTNMPANTLAQNNCGFYVWAHTGHMAATASGSGSALGAIDGTSVGFSLVVNNSGNINGRCASTNFASLGGSDGFGLFGLSRNNSANFDVHRNGTTPNTQASTSAALPSLNITVLAINNNGTISGNAVTQQAFWWFGQALTEAEARALTGIIGEYLERLRYGMPIVQEVGIGDADITCDLAFYGTGAQTLCAAYSAKRFNPALDVKIFGGWRDRHNLGGMAGGGLGFTDHDQPQWGGLGRWLVTRCNAMAGVTDDHVANGISVYKFQPKYFRRACLELLNPALNGGLDIPIYLTNGVTSVARSGTEATIATFTDGRTVTAGQFLDGCYEMDMYRLTGLTYRKGREAAGSGAEANNGVEATADCAQPLDGAGNGINVDPWVTPGVSASGLLPGVETVSSTFHPEIHTYPAVGSADNRIPSYNFRLTFTTTSTRRAALPTTPPPGFDPLRYELHLRKIAAAAAVPAPMTVTTIFKVDDLRSSGRFDINNSNLLSSNNTGNNHSYPEASYAAREVIWKDHWNYIMGLWYVLQHYDDARINGSALRTSALTYGLCTDHYYSPHENDEVFWMPQMYVRESIRAVSDVIMDGNHMIQTDGQVPTLGTKTVSLASYKMDSHSTMNMALEVSDGVFTVKAEGGMLINSGGTNELSPLPFEIFVPKVSECTNMCFVFGCSTTHVSYGTTRMEPVAMMTGQSLGIAMALAHAGDGVIQNVDYPTLRAALLASPSLTGEIAPVLPQVT